MAIFDDLPYRSFDVLIMEPNRVEQGVTVFDRELEEHDNKVSLPLRYDPAKLTFPSQKFFWLLENRKAKIDFYRFLYRVRGRQKAFWAPSWREDLELAGDIAGGSNQFGIKNVGLAGFGGNGYVYLMFFMADGTYKYRQVIDVNELSAEFEMVTVDRPFFAPVLASDVLMVSFMTIVRLDTDLIEIRHQTDMNGVATSVTVLKTCWNLRNV